MSMQFGFHMIENTDYSAKIMITRQVSSMIHSARTTVSPVANIVFPWNLFWFVKSVDVRTDDMYGYNDR